MVYNSRSLSILVLFLLIISLFSGFTSGLTIEKQNNTNEYIVELTDSPLFQHINSIRNKVKNNLLLKTDISSYKNSLVDAHKNLKNKILSLFNGKYRNRIVFSNEFYGIFNGFCIKNVPDTLVEKIKDLSFVKDVFPNYHFKICLDDSVPLIKAPEVWKLYDKYGRNIRGDGVSIAILDTGVDYTHPDLSDSYVGGYDFVNNDSDPMDDNGHGTHCAGILVGSGVSSNHTYVGVAPDADLYVYKILNESGGANYTQFIQGIEAAIDPNNDGDPSDHVDIMSLSFGTEEPGSPDDPISSEIDEVVDMGIVVVAAAGNLGEYGSRTITSPGCSREAITVGSITKYKQIAYSSSRGPVELNGNLYIKPDVVAPGVDITSTRLGGGYTTKSGTSMAAPHVAGAAALLLQANPDWTPSMIKNALENTAEDLGNTGKDNTYGSGLIDVFEAVNSSTNKPIAILDMPYAVPLGNISIRGTAMNGTGNPEDFANYSVFYKNDTSWIKIFESDTEVLDGVLCHWNTKNLEPGMYQIKLDVRGDNLSNIVTKDIAVGYDSDRIIIVAPSEITEKSNFNVSLVDINNESVNAFVIFFVPFKLPRIKYGSTVEFNAPNILNPFVISLNGRIVVFKMIGLRKESTTIKILNQQT